MTRGLLPDFLGIGAPRAGTTWLHDLLSAHPDACLPTVRKELNYFDLNHERGEGWYAGCFVPAVGTSPVAVGEITPVYMYRDEVLPRVVALGTVKRFIVCLRDPVDLLWSGYKQNSAIYDFRGDLRAFMDARPDVVANGLYAQALRPWFAQFGRDAFLVLRFDRMFTDLDATKQALADFLGLDVGRFPADAGVAQANRSGTPRFRRAFSLASRAAARFHRADLSWLVNAGKAIGLKRMVATGGDDGRPLDDAERAALREIYRDDVSDLAALIGQDLDPWLG